MRRSWPTLAQALLCSLLSTSALGAGATQADTPMPYYSAAQALRSLYNAQLPPQAQAFEQQAQLLAQRLPALCQGQATPTQLHAQWQRTLQAWAELATPALGPVLSRRAHRQIDFWPTRPELIAKAVEKAPRTLADLDTVGTPAKGLPALEHLLTPTTKLNPAQCAYATLLAQDVAATAHTLQQDFATLATQDWDDSPEQTGSAMAEWINQWLAGLEKLRWAHIEKPVRAANGKPPAFVRLARDSNRQEWQAQWRSLLAQARLTPAQRQQPPQAGLSLIPIEALLLGKGQLALAQRWRQTLDQADSTLARLPADAPPAALLGLAQSLKNVSLLFQNEVAPALDIPLGFSDADGD